MYGAELAEVYDLVHQERGKGFRAEADDVTALIRSRAPAAGSLLDIACGTGAHLRCFADLFPHVEGVELSEAMLTVARARLPGAALHKADLRTFDLGRTFDAVTCMFGSIGYATSPAELVGALRRVAAHLSPTGVAIIDPWWFAETFLDGYVSADVVTADGRTVTRLSHSARHGDTSRMQVHYVVADARSGARHFAETHEISLFSRKQYREAFRAAGLRVDHVEGVVSQRGLFVAGHA
ncbi:MAG TPA: class I SAM-dependent methyltransferase [Catenuloplanes sp.]